MKNCKNCNNKLDDQAKFCPQCGTKIEQEPENSIDETVSKIFEKDLKIEEPEKVVEEKDELDAVVGNIFASSNADKEFFESTSQRVVNNRIKAAVFGAKILTVVIVIAVLSHIIYYQVTEPSSEAKRERATFLRLAKEYMFLPEAEDGAGGKNDLFVPEKIIQYIKYQADKYNNLPIIEEYHENVITTDVANYIFKVDGAKIVIEIDE